MHRARPCDRPREQIGHVIGTEIRYCIFEVMGPSLQDFVWRQRIEQYSTYRPNDANRLASTRDLEFSLQAIYACIERYPQLIPPQHLNVGKMMT